MFHQCFDIIEYKLYYPKTPWCKKKPPENASNIFSDNKGVDFINLPWFFVIQG